jgi:hypothetical protein
MRNDIYKAHILIFRSQEYSVRCHLQWRHLPGCSYIKPDDFARWNNIGPCFEDMIMVGEKSRNPGHPVEDERVWRKNWYVN